MTPRQIVGKIGLWFSVFVIVSPAILFFLWMLSLSLKFEIDNAAYPPVFFPEHVAWKNYADVLASNRFLTYFINSLIVTGSATLLALLVGVPAGYGIARIAREMGMHRRTVRRYLATPAPPRNRPAEHPEPSGLTSPTRRSRTAATSGPMVVPNRFDTCSRVRAWVASASATAGCEWPSEVTASPERKSR